MEQRRYRCGVYIDHLGYCYCEECASHKPGIGAPTYTPESAVHEECRVCDGCEADLTEPVPPPPYFHSPTDMILDHRVTVRVF